MTQQLDALLAETLCWPVPRFSFRDELLSSLYSSRYGNRFAKVQIEADKDVDSRWVMLGAVGAAGAAYAIYRKHHRKGVA